MMFGLFTPFFYLPSYAVSRGMSAELASFLIAILNATSFFGRVIPGVLGDKFGRVNIFFVAGITTAVMIFCFTVAKTNAQIIVSSHSSLFAKLEGHRC
jgi:MFS family permease